MKTRVFKKPDGTVIYCTPSAKYQGGTFVDDKTKPIFDNKDKNKIIGYEKRELTFNDCQLVKPGQEWERYPYIDIDNSELPASNSKTGDFHEMIYFDGDCKKENLKQDKSWEKCLMPVFLIREKHFKNINRKLDEMASSNNIDTVEYIKLQREKEKAKSEKDECFWHECALEGLNRAEIDKPIIKQKLEAKIMELKNSKK